MKTGREEPCIGEDGSTGESVIAARPQPAGTGGATAQRRDLT